MATSHDTVKRILDIDGMTSVAGVSRIERIACRHEGVYDASASFLKHTLELSYDGTSATLSAVFADLEKAGYHAAMRSKAGLFDTLPPDTAPALRHLSRQLAVSCVFALALLYLSFGISYGLPLPAYLADATHSMTVAAIELVLLVPVVYLNFQHFRSGFRSLARRSPDSDTLVAVGCTALFVYSLYSSYVIARCLGAGDMVGVHIATTNLYFESIAGILTIVSVGKYFEYKARTQTTGTVSHLVDLVPRRAHCRRSSGDEDVDVAYVQVGDTLVVEDGENIPADGVIVQGATTVDESLVTGEHDLLDKSVGDDVYGGTTNTSGSFAMRVTRVGDDMTLANIIRMVDDATNSKAPIERTADRSCSFLVFAIIVGAAVVCFLWGHFGGAVNTGIVCGASLLVTASVSALGLSTPTAIMISIEKAALNGILMKSSEALEKAKQLEVIVFEKTGILTTGRPSITEIIPSAGITREELLGFAASLEEQATHPLGRAICEYADQSECPSFLVTDFEENPGAGVAGTVAGRRCLGGNKRLMKANGVDVTDYLFVVRRLCDHGRTPLFFTAGGKVLGIIALADSPRKNSARAIAELKSRGVKTVMLTGDNRRTAEFIQRRVGTSRVIAEVAPADREGKIRELGRGVTIAMVGDRTADAASLARADLGIAIGTGNDTDMGAANVMLIHDNLLGIPALVQLGCATMATIRRDIVWAIVYNVVLIPIACGAFVPLGFVLDPLVGACAMSLFSLLLVYRALRLREWAPSFHAPENMHPSIPPRVRRAVNTDSLVNFDTTEFDRVSETGAFRPVPSETDAVAGVRPLPRDVLTDDRGAFVVPDPSSSGTLRPTLVLTNTSGDAVERPSTLPDQTLMFRTLVIEDMTSDADVELVTSALEQVDGVAAVRVNLPRHKLIVELERPLSRRLLVKMVASVGFSAVSKDMDAADIKREQRTENRRERRELRREQREEQREKVVDIDEQRTQNRALMESLEGEGGQPQDAEGVSGKGRKTRQERRTRHHAGRVTDRAVETDAQGSARQTEQPAGRRRHARGAHAATPSSAGTVRQHARRASLERMTERLDQHEQQRRRHLANVEERRRRYERADGSGLDETDVQAGKQPRPEAATDRPGGDGVASGTSATSASQPRYPYPSDPNWYINDDDQLLDDDSDIDTSPDRI